MTVSPLADRDVEHWFSPVVNRASRFVDRIRQLAFLDVAWVIGVLAVAVYAGWLLLGVGLTLTVLVGGLALGVTAYVLQSDHPVVRGVGVLLSYPAGLLLLVGPAAAGSVALSSPARAGVVSVTAAAIAAIGFAATQATTENLARNAGVAAGRIRNSLFGPMVLVAIVVVPGLALTGELTSVAGEVTGVLVDHMLARDPTLAFGTFPLLVFVSASLLRTAVRVIPLDMAVSSNNRERATALLDRTQRGLSYLANGAIVAGLFGIAIIGGELGKFPTPDGIAILLPAPAGRVVAVLLTTAVIRVFLLAVLAVAFTTLVGFYLYNWWQRTSIEQVGRAFVPPLTAAGAAALLGSQLEDPAIVQTYERLAVDAIGPVSAELVQSVDPYVLGVVTAIALASGTGFALRGTSLFARFALPQRTADVALGSAATFTLAAVFTLVGQSLIALLFGAIAIGLWDIGEYARHLQWSLGRGATSRAELVHLAGTAAIGLISVIGVVVVLGIIAGSTIAAGPSGLLALLSATLAATLLLYTL